MSSKYGDFTKRPGNHIKLKREETEEKTFVQEEATCAESAEECLALVSLIHIKFGIFIRAMFMHAFCSYEIGVMPCLISSCPTC